MLFGFTAPFSDRGYGAIWGRATKNQKGGGAGGSWGEVEKEEEERIASHKNKKTTGDD